MPNAMNDIKISNPSEVAIHIKRINAILALYQESTYSDLTEIASFERFLINAKQTISDRRVRLQIALEQTGKNGEGSDAANTASRGIQAQIDKCDEYLRNINQCQTDYIAIRQDQSRIAKESIDLSDVSKTLSRKIELYITKIAEVM